MPSPGTASTFAQDEPPPSGAGARASRRPRRDEARSNGAGSDDTGWRIQVDGAARGNPGPAAAGILIYGPGNVCRRRIGRTLGVLTNNQAEYRALLIALDAVGPFQPPRLAVWMDSELLVKQLNGQYQVKHPVLRPLYERARAALGRLGAVQIRHVLRGQNAAADHLANLALDGTPTDWSSTAA